MSERVLLIGDYPPPPGGVATHVWQLRQFLEEQGAEVRVLDIGKGPLDKEGVLRARSGVSAVWHGSRHAASGWVVHLHTAGNNPRSWMVTAAVGLLPGPAARRFVTFHSGALPEFLRGDRRRFARASLSGYGTVMAVSEPLRAALLEAGVPSAKVSVYPPFLASQVRPGAPPAAFAQARARFAPLVAYAHHPAPWYGREVMVAALAKLAARAPLCGLAVFGPESQAVVAAAQALGVAERVVALGALEPSSALAVIAGSDVFARPTTVDGDAISIREALALGTPAVASDVVARPAGTRCFPTGDAAALAEALLESVERGRVRVPAVDVGPVLLEQYRRAREGEHAAAGRFA